MEEDSNAPTEQSPKLDLYDKVEAKSESIAERAVQLKTQLADSGMEKSAEWLRETNMSSIKQGLAREVKENPGRTLLIAGAIGYLLGRAFKGKDA